jgi:hypothetical protein
MRLVRAVGALLVLVAAVVGVPVALVVWVGNPLPSTSGLLGRLLRPDDGGLLVGLITVVAWVAWLVVTVSVLVELVNLLTAVRRGVGRIRLPGLAGPQQLAGVLLAAVVAAVLVPVVARHPTAGLVTPPGPGAPSDTASSSTATSSSTPSSTASSSASPSSTASSSAAPSPPDAVPLAAPHGEHAAPKVPKGHLHVVERGDDLWTLAERFYGQGREWRRIAAANPDELTGGPDRLRVGSRLVIPGVPATPPTGGDRVVVHEGDTLSSLAERVLGDAADWPLIFAANRHLIADPDEVDAGLVLIVPPRPDGPTASRPPSRPEPTPKADGRKPSRPESPSASPRPEASPKARPSQGPSQGPSQAAPSEAVPSRAVPSPAVPSQAVPSEAVPSPAVPSPAVPSGAAPTETAPVPAAPSGTSAEVAPWVPGVGGLLATGLLAGLLVRRRLQLAARPVGRRILHPSAEAQLLETALGHQQHPLTVASLDLVLRAVALHCHRTGRTLPELMAARVSPAEIELVLRVPDPQPPVGFVARGRRWLVAAGDTGYLADLDGIEGAPRAYPTLVTVGTDDEGRQVLVELEQAGEFGYAGLDDDEADGFVLGLAAELALAPWADELFVTLVGSDGSLPAAAARHNLTRADDVDELLDRLERRAEVQRRHLTDGSARQQRVDPELSDPWAPEVVLVARALDPGRTARLRALVTSRPRVTTAAVVPVHRDDLATGLAQVPADVSSPGVTVELRPLGWELDLQRLSTPVRTQVVELLGVTGSDATSPAPWWHHHEPDAHPTTHRSTPPATRPSIPPTTSRAAPSTASSTTPVPAELSTVLAADLPPDLPDDQPVDLPPDLPPELPDDLPADQHPPSSSHGAGEDAPTPLADVTVLTPAPRRAWANEEDAAVARLSADPTGPVHHPTVLLLGPIDLVGAAGVPPTRAAKQCVEYCAWLLEHPLSTAPAMAAALAVAEGTRRSNVSRLRSWLGDDVDGEPYLPDAYSGRIVLDPAVSSDWQRLQVLTAPGINRTSTDGLVAALDLVRGAPLADAAPGQWHWAEELRTDMASAVRDLGVEITDRALADDDLDLARWAASRALVAAPEDEQLLCARIRTEHRAGRTAEVERLVRRVAAQARTLGIDLDADTVILLQQVMEGRVRARTGTASF